MKFLAWILIMMLPALTNVSRADEGLQGTIDPDYFELQPKSLDNSFVPWAKPLTGGPIRVVFVVPLSAGREVAELHRRLDVQAYTVLVKPHVGLPEGQLGFNPGPFGHYNSIAGFTQAEMIDKLKQALEQQVDLIVIGNVEWSILTAPIQERIESMVKGGAGLLLIHQPPADVEAWKKKIEPAESLPASPKSVALSQVEQLISDAVPSTRRDQDQLWAGQLGKGRVSILHWQEPPGDRTRRLALMLSHSLTPSWPICQYTRDGWSYEFEMAAVIKAMLWTAGREAAAHISSVESPKSAMIGQSGDVIVTIDARRAADMTVEYSLRRLDNTIVRRESVKAGISVGGGKVSCPIMLPAGGTYAVDVMLRDGDRIVDFAAGVVQSASNLQLSITVQNPNRMPGERINGRINLKGAVGSQPVRVEAYDAKNRLLASAVVEVEESEHAEFSLQPIESLTAYNLVIATRQVNGITFEQAQAPCIVDRRDQTRNQYHVTMWNWVPTDFLTSVFLKRYVELGIDSLYHNDYYKFDLEHLERGTWEAGRAGIEVGPYLWRDYAYAKKDLHDVVREPCLNSPSYRESVKQTIGTYAKLAAKFAAPYSTLGDEPYLVAFWEGVNGRDVCFAPDTLADFRNYLKTKYSTLEAVNQSWGASFADWEQVTPIIFEDAMAQSQLPRWLDHRQHMTRVFQGMLDFEQDVIRQADPRMPTGPEGMYPWDPFKGYDFERMSQMGYVGPYGTAHGEISHLACAQIAAYHAPGNRRMTITGWYNTMPRSRQYSWSDVWWSAFYGYNGTLYFMGDPGSTMSGFTPDHRPTMYLDDTLAAVRELRGGIFDLIQNIDRNQGEVAILHSEPSYILSLSVTPSGGEQANPVFSAGQSETIASYQAVRWLRLLNDIGIPHTHLSSRQVESGSLRKGVRVLILPVAMCLTDREVSEVKSFVSAGGIVVADVLPAALNQNGGPRVGGALDDVFGIKQADATLTAVNQVMESHDAKIPIEQSSKLELTSATAIRKIGGHPVFIQNRHGQGRALLLNTTLLGYDKLRKEGRQGSFAKYVGDWLRQAGVKSRYVLLPSPDGHASSIEMIPYIKGMQEYLAIVKQPKYTVPGSEKFQIKLPETRHVYDVRQEKYLGETNRLAGQCAGDNPRLFAMLPYRIQNVTISSQGGSVAPGQSALFNGKVSADNAEPVGDHVIRLEVQGPDGPLPQYTQVILAPSGQFKVSVPTAFNDAKGEWTVTATEIVSGSLASVKLTVN